MPQRILIAEDDKLQGEVLRAALASRGYEAEIVTDGLEAVRRLRASHYDLALLDYHMPEVDGLAAAQLLHDLMDDGERPRLIAITAAAQGLSEREQVSGAPSFDAVVSKQLGLPALLEVVDANLATAAELNAAMVIERGQEAVRLTAVIRRRRWLAPLAALPALAMAAAFAVAFGWAVTALHDADGAVGSARQSGLLGTNTAALVGAVSDMEASQRTYLATGTIANREVFETDAQRVDQILVGSAALTADGTPGIGMDSAMPSVVELRIRALAGEARSRSETPAAPAVSDGGRDAAEWLRGWAASMMSTSQQAMLAGVEAMRRNTELVLVVLAAGVLYGLWNAALIVRRRWRAASSALMLRPLKGQPHAGHGSLAGPRVSTTALVHDR